MKVLVIGAYGQDGQIISRAHRDLGDQVIGVVRSGSQNAIQVDGIIKMDLADNRDCQDFLDVVRPQVIYNVAAVHGSAITQQFLVEKESKSIFDCTVTITQNLSNWVKLHPTTRLHIALSSQMFVPGESDTYINELSVPSPKNYYAETKLQAWDIIKRYRSDYGLKLNASILFNHSSEFGSSKFIFPTLVDKILASNYSDIHTLDLYNPYARIDITDAKEICAAIIKSTATEVAEDFVLGSGGLVSIFELVNHVNFKFGGKKSAETNLADIEELNVPTLISDISKVKKQLSWEPKVTPFDLLERMTRFKLVENINAKIQSS